MVHLEPWQGFAADAAGSGVLLAATALGLPVSTTHTKTMALLGVGAARRFSAVRLAVARDLAAAWVLTFPGCGLLSFLLTRVLTALA